ncbi:MAG: octopine/nopaline transport system substrate-binding [Beijerinckiaceae bacterium]|nr:MAG: octopine/nopaline transport system substrate-binding [Beijerinckiaceae bacterium]
MKNGLKTLLLAAPLCFMGIAQAQTQTVRIATEGAYAPYNFKDSSGKLVGFEIDLAAELCKRAALSCEVHEQAWDGIVPSLLANKYDAIMAAMNITEKREAVISFSRPYVKTPIRFVTTRKGTGADFVSSLPAITLEDIDATETAEIGKLSKLLAGKTIGVQAATAHEGFVKEHMKGATIKSYDKMDNMILDLTAGRIDVGYTSVTFLAPILKKTPDLVEFGPLMTGGQLGRGVAVGVRKTDTDLQKKFSAAIGGMLGDGSMSALAVKWFGIDISAK